MLTQLFKGWRLYLSEARIEASHSKVRRKDLEKVFTVFHLSGNRLEEDGDFVFNPRIPKRPANGEDNFTKRISLAPDFKGAIEALGGWCPGCHVYVGDVKQDPSDDIPVLHLDVELRRCKRELSSPPDNRYGPNFNFFRWMKQELPAKAGDWTAGPKVLPAKHKKKFYACVPDANSTHELWSLKDVKLYYVGVLEGAYVYLSKEGYEFLSHVKDKYFKGN